MSVAQGQEVAARRGGRWQAGAAVAKVVLGVQGIYYLATGVWPLVHLESFEAVTGPKVDHWLVQTVGVLIAANALVLLSGLRRRVPAGEVAFLAVLDAVALGAVDAVFVARAVIPPVYLLDAGAELVLLLGWALAYCLWPARETGGFQDFTP